MSFFKISSVSDEDPAHLMPFRQNKQTASFILMYFLSALTSCCVLIVFSVIRALDESVIPSEVWV